MSSMRDQLWPVFVAEVTEQLEGLEVALEPGARTPAAIDVNEVFRFFHTIKSSGSMMDFHSMEQVAHASEDLLFVLRKHERPVDADSYALLLRAVDALKRQLAQVTDSQQNPPGDDELVAALAACAATVAAAAEAAGPAVLATSTAPADEAASVRQETASGETMRVNAQTLDTLVANVGHMAMREHRFSHAVHSAAVEAALAQSRALLESAQPQDWQQQDLAAIHDLLAVFEDYQQLVTETDYEVSSALKQIEQDVLDLRVVPINAVFNRLPVLVKKTSESSQKDVDLVTEGAEVKVDKRMVDTLMEPLVHIIRNAIDHGIETPSERLAKGKPATGTVTIRASQDSGMLQLEISDDGKGLDLQRIENKARRLGLVAPHEQPLSAERIRDLIFMPGFSTAEKITETSGRGVGMDVVRTRITSLGGSVRVDSVPGEYTCFHLSMPLSVAIQGVLLVRDGEHAYAMPLRAVSEIIAIDPAQLQLVNGQSALQFRDGVLPVCTLSHLLGRAPQPVLPGSTREVVVLLHHELWLGLMIDGVIGRQELIVREVHPDLAALPAFGGVSLLGDGSVVMILDLDHLFSMASSHREQLGAAQEPVA